MISCVFLGMVAPALIVANSTARPDLHVSMFSLKQAFGTLPFQASLSQIETQVQSMTGCTESSEQKFQNFTQSSHLFMISKECNAQLQVLAADEEHWNQEMQQRRHDGLNEAGFMAALRRRMERVVLTLDSGSHAQRIQVCALITVNACFPVCVVYSTARRCSTSEVSSCVCSWICRSGLACMCCYGKNIPTRYVIILACVSKTCFAVMTGAECGEMAYVAVTHERMDRIDQQRNIGAYTNEQRIATCLPGMITATNILSLCTSGLCFS